MAGASNTERQSAIIVESMAGTTPATPAFKILPAGTLKMVAKDVISESKTLATKGQRSNVARNGKDVTGSLEGELVYGAYDEFLESMFQSEWSGDVLINGTAQKTFTVENAIPKGVGGDLAYIRFRGVECGNGSISLEAKSPVKMQFDLLGLGADEATAVGITGATYADPTATEVIGSGADIGTITMSGFAELDCMKTLTMQFNNEGKEGQPKIGSNDLCGVDRGAFLPEITGQFYVEDSVIDIYNASQTGQIFALSIPIGATTGEKYLFEFPKCTFVETSIETGESGPAFQPFKILPLYDSAMGGTCRVTRGIA